MFKINNILIYSPVVDTVNIFLKTTINHLNNNNYKVTVMYNPSLSLNYTNNILSYNNYFTKGNNSNPFTYFFDLINISKIRDNEIIVFNGSTTIILATFIKLIFFNKRIIYILHGTLKSKGFLNNFIFLFFLIFSNLIGIEVYSVNKYFNKYFFRKKLFNYIGIAGVGIDERIVENLIQLRKYLNFDKKNYTIAFIGRHEISKGYDLYESIARINSDKNLSFISIGGFSKMNETSIIQYGPVEYQSLIELLRNIDILVLPSKSEGLGMVMVECCIAGIPTITTETEGSLQFLNKKIGSIINSRNPKHFLLEIQNMIKNLNYYSKNCIDYSNQNNNFISKPFLKI